MATGKYFTRPQHYARAGLFVLAREFARYRFYFRYPLIFFTFNTDIILTHYFSIIVFVVTVMDHTEQKQLQHVKNRRKVINRLMLTCNIRKYALANIKYCHICIAFQDCRPNTVRKEKQS